MIVSKYSEKITLYGKEAKKIIYKTPKYCHITERSDYSQNRENNRRDDSLARTRTKIYQLVHCNTRAYNRHPPIFVTLTFAKNITDVKQANHDFLLFTQRLTRHVGHPLRHLSIIEFQTRGAVHFHTVFFNLPYIPYAQLQSIWGHGMTRIEKGSSIRNLSAYIAKYLSKDILDQRLKGHRVLKVSRGLVRPQIFTDPIHDPTLHHDIIQKVESTTRIIETKVKN